MKPWRVIVSAVWLISATGAGVSPLRAQGLGLTPAGVVFPDGTVQTTAGQSEIANAFVAYASLTISPPFVNNFAYPMTVPTGYRALIEQISFLCTSPPTNSAMYGLLYAIRRISPTSETSVPFVVPLQYQGSGFFGPTHVGTLAIHVYADASLFGSALTLAVYRTNGTDTTSCSLSLAGRLFPIPPNEALLAIGPAQEPPGVVTLPASALLPGENPATLPNGALIRFEAPPDH